MKREVPSGLCIKLAPRLLREWIMCFVFCLLYWVCSLYLSTLAVPLEMLPIELEFKFLMAGQNWCSVVLKFSFFFSVLVEGT